MLSVKITNGDHEGKERTINDLSELRATVAVLISEFEKVLQEDDMQREERLKAELKEELREELRDEILDEALYGTGYDSIDEMRDRIEQLESAIEDVYYTVSDVRL